MRIHHRMAMILTAMGAWVAHQRQELVNKVGEQRAVKIESMPGKRSKQKSRGGFGPLSRPIGDQMLVGSRSAKRRSVRMFKALSTSRHPMRDTPTSNQPGKAPSQRDQHRADVAARRAANQIR